MTELPTVIIEFTGGPLDGWSNERAALVPVLVPEVLVADRSGVYRVRLHCCRHYVYDWHEGVRAER